MVLTQDPVSPRAEALAVAGGRIVAVGRDDDVLALEGPGTRRVALGGRALVPGFDDAHAHLWKVGHLLTTLLDLRGVTDLGELRTRLQERSATLPEGAWLLGRGYDEQRLREGRPPTLAELDAWIPARPVFLIRTCAHMAVANGAALRAAGLSAGTPDPPGGQLERLPGGEPSGRFRETGLGLVQRAIPPPTAAEYAAMIEAASLHQLRLGITSTTDAGCAPELLAVYRALESQQGLRQRVNAMASRLGEGGGPHALPAPLVSERLRIDTIKLWADGGLSGATAALREPYRHAPGCGILRMSSGEMAEHAVAAREVGLRTAIHAIGDAAIDATLAALEQAAGGDAPPDPAAQRRPPDRIEHFGVPDADHLERTARLGAFVVPQAIFLRELGASFRRNVDESLLPRVYPLRAMLEAGLPMALSSDAPVVECDDPLAGIQAAVLRTDAEGAEISREQAISTSEALRAYTRGGALARGDGDRGLLRAGQRADLAVLSRDPVATPPEALHEIRVEQTWISGQLAWEA